MASNPIPEGVRRQVWNSLRPYKDIVIVKVPFLGGLTVNWFLNRLLGYDRGHEV